MKCPKCQAELPDNARFCNRCGKSIQAEMICSRCQHHNPQDSSFCLQCGQPLTSEKAKPSASPIVSSQPTSFANGRYQVKKFLGEGGKKKVYLAHDTVTLIGKVKLVLAELPKSEGVELVVKTKDGRTLSEYVAQAQGEPSRPLSRDTLVAKFMEQAEFTQMVSKKNAEEIIRLVDKLEEVDNINKIVELAVKR